jgi:hypothetical protein
MTFRPTFIFQRMDATALKDDPPINCAGAHGQRRMVEA